MISVTSAIEEQLRTEFRPTLKQEKFIQVPWEVHEAGYGGALGAGKTQVLMLMPALYNWLDNPRFRGLLLRRTFPELEQEVIIRSKEYFPSLGGVYNIAKHRWEFPRGAMFTFGHLKEEKDVKKYDTGQFPYIGWDESTSFTGYQYEYLTLRRNRAPVGSGLPSIVRWGSNPGNVGHCVDSGEVLTSNGWIDISKLEVGDSVYEVDGNFNLVDSHVEQVHKYEYSGDLWKCKTSNLQMSCTPEHDVVRLVGKKGVGTKFVREAVNKLPGQANIARTAKLDTSDGLNESIFILPDYDGKVINKQPSILAYTDYTELLGWFLSEGYTTEVNQSGRFGISQMKINHRKTIKDLLDRCEFTYSELPDGYLIHSPAWYNYLKQFGKSRDKFIPREVLNSSEGLRELFTSLMSGDGHWRNKNSGAYYTISKQLADDFCELAFKLGYLVYLTSRQRENREGLSYEVHFSSNTSTEILTGQHKYKVNTSVKRPSNVRTEKFFGTVYDIGVPLHHTFVIRQNGYVWISGNSYFRKRFIDPAPEGSKLIKDPKTGALRIFIPATAKDNPHLIEANPNYFKNLEQITSEAERRAMILGDWYTFEGQVFEEFRIEPLRDEPDNARHVVDPFAIPSWWPKIIGIDWGFAAFCFIIWAAISPDGRVYIYRTYAVKKVKIREWTRDLALLSAGEIDNVRDIRICWSAVQDRGQDQTIYEQTAEALGEAGFKCGLTLGDKNRVAGKQLVHEYLRWKPLPTIKTIIGEYNQDLARRIERLNGREAMLEYAAAYNPEEPERNLPKLQIFSRSPEGNSTSQLTEAISTCVYDEVKKEDVKEFDGDDAYDCLRILLNGCRDYFAESAKEFEVQQRIGLATSKLAASNNQTSFYRMCEHAEADSNENISVRKMSRMRRSRR